MEQICKMCGGKLEIDAFRQIATCPYCDTVFSLSEKVEKTRQRWETWVQGDDYRRFLQEALQEKMAENQKLQRKSDRLWNWLDLPLRIACVFLIFFFAVLLGVSVNIGIETMGNLSREEVLVPVIGTILLLLFYLILVMIPIVALWLLWRWKDRYGTSLQAKGATDFYQRELQLWHTVHSLENYRNGVVEEESYRR